MYTLTSSGTDSHVAHVVVTRQACGYFEEHFRYHGLEQVGNRCDPGREKDRHA